MSCTHVYIKILKTRLKRNKNQNMIPKPSVP
jgi:hypothetical protein